MPKETASLLLAIIGIASTLGRIVLGYVADKPWANRLLAYNLSLAICGLGKFNYIFYGKFRLNNEVKTMTIFNMFVAIISSAWCSTFESFSVYATVFGFSGGAFVGLQSVILVDLLGLEQMTNGFGLVILFQGVASFLGSPMVGKNTRN